MAVLPSIMSLNWFIPALVNISVGSSLITIGADGTIWCLFDAKKDKNDSRISCAVSIFEYVNNLLKPCKWGANIGQNLHLRLNHKG